MTTSTASPFEAFRGTSAWLGFLSGDTGPQWPGGWLYVTYPYLIVATVVLAVLGLAGIALRRTPERTFLAVALVVGLSLLTAGHTGVAGRAVVRRPAVAHGRGAGRLPQRAQVRPRGPAAPVPRAGQPALGRTGPAAPGRRQGLGGAPAAHQPRRHRHRAGHRGQPRAGGVLPRDACPLVAGGPVARRAAAGGGGAGAARLRPSPTSPGGRPRTTRSRPSCIDRSCCATPCPSARPEPPASSTAWGASWAPDAAGRGSGQRSRRPACATSSCPTSCGWTSRGTRCSRCTRGWSRAGCSALRRSGRRRATPSRRRRPRWTTARWCRARASRSTR